MRLNIFKNKLAALQKIQYDDKNILKINKNSSEESSKFVEQNENEIPKFMTLSKLDWENNEIHAGIIKDERGLPADVDRRADVVVLDGQIQDDVPFVGDPHHSDGEVDADILIAVRRLGKPLEEVDHRRDAGEAGEGLPGLRRARGQREVPPRHRKGRIRDSAICGSARRNRLK